MIAYTEKTGDGQAVLILKNNYMEIEADWKKLERFEGFSWIMDTSSRQRKLRDKSPGKSAGKSK
ncbi:MAG: hypothetical protein A2168_06080 [Planctomycetes bacterium RBG_13_50_24]|nr:MAG: hypothetical protein A2168_06080 [Planctomycetes bacterium RBG_13_50_24]